MTLIDSNILIDVWSRDPEWYEWSSEALQAAANRGSIVVNPIVIAELCPGVGSEEILIENLSAAGVKRIALPANAAWIAARAFAAYRRGGGPRTSPLPDFFIGAHALVEKWPLLTRDPKRYRAYFPKLKLIAPR